jgi:hypothetical protein
VVKFSGNYGILVGQTKALVTVFPLPPIVLMFEQVAIGPVLEKSESVQRNFPDSLAAFCCSSGVDLECRG